MTLASFGLGMKERFLFSIRQAADPFKRKEGPRDPNFYDLGVAPGSSSFGDVAPIAVLSEHPLFL